MPRFVIQKHSKRKTGHFDLMLESNRVLKTWSFTWPLRKYRHLNRFLPVQPIKQLPDHRIIYLDYEGKISRNRGSVKIWDKGIYRKIIWSGALKVVVLKGQRIAGLLVITSLRPHSRLRLIPLIRFL